MIAKDEIYRLRDNHDIPCLLGSEWERILCHVEALHVAVEAFNEIGNPDLRADYQLMARDALAKIKELLGETNDR